MKNLLSSALLLLFITIVSSCDGPKKTSENQPAASQASDQTDKMAETAVTTDAAKTEDGNPANQVTESLSGSQIVSTASSRLVSKLVLNEQQITSVNGFLNKSFIDYGGDLTKVYSAEESKTIIREIIMKAKDPIMGILNDTQKEQFSKYGQRK